MGSCGQSSGGGGGWFLDYGLVDDIPAADDDYIWSTQMIEDTNVASAILDFDASRQEESRQDKDCSKKRPRMESCAAPGTKACREKMRRDKLNDRFAELCSIVDPGRPPKADKVAVLSDAARLLNQLRLEAQKLKESNETLQDTIKNLKVEKSELRDEKVRLKAEKEWMEQLLKGTRVAPPYISHPAAAVAAYHAAALANCNKTVPYQNYPAMGMWRWIPQASLDTSQDHVLRPPVA